MRASDLIWTPADDGEYNEATAPYRGHTITVFSDRDGDKWEYRIDDDETQFVAESSKLSAAREAMLDIDSMVRS